VIFLAIIKDGDVIGIAGKVRDDMLYQSFSETGPGMICRMVLTW